MLPFERLRALARHAGDDTELVVEAADCLTDFAHDPTQIVTVCRRLLAHHPACGPLWWLCARVVSAPDPAAAARAGARILEDDRTTSRLVSVLPFPHDEPISVLGWPEKTGAAIGERPDLDVLSVRRRGDDTHVRARLARTGRPVRIVDETEAIALAPSHLVVEVLAASPAVALVPAGTADLRWALGEATLWFVVAAGRLLPARLFEVLERETGRQELDVETLEVTRAARVAGPSGLEDPTRLVHRVDCPAAPELLRL